MCLLKSACIPGTILPPGFDFTVGTHVPAALRPMSCEPSWQLQRRPWSKSGSGGRGPCSPRRWGESAGGFHGLGRWGFGAQGGVVPGGKEGSRAFILNLSYMSPHSTCPIMHHTMPIGLRNGGMHCWRALLDQRPVTPCCALTPPTRRLT